MSVYRSLEGPYTKTDFEVESLLPHSAVKNFTTFRHCNLPLMGVGPDGVQNKFMYFDKLLDTALLKKIRAEVAAGAEKQIVGFNKIVANGIMPASINGQKSIDSYIDNIRKYAPDNSWEKSIATLTRKGDIKIFLHDYFKIKAAWEGIAMFRKYNGSYEDKSKPSEWLGIIEHFPTLQKFVDNLPFKFIGYVMIFKSTGKNPVLVHRDYYPTNHTVNFINFRLEQQERPFFLYDCFTDKKSYIRQNSDAYFFNEIDPHGLDQESETRLTLRVEGQFLDSFKDQIGLGNNDTFNWNYDHCASFLKSGEFKIIKDTDI